MTLANRKLIEKFGRDFTSKKTTRISGLTSSRNTRTTRRSKPRL